MAYKDQYTLRQEADKGQIPSICHWVAVGDCRPIRLICNRVLHAFKEKYTL